MSWLEQIQSDLIITTGDGKKYKPSWLNAQKQKDYNFAEFEFPNLAGTLVKRTKPKGARYNLELYIQGENHLDDALAFEKSCDDERPWVIDHPFYGKITVQPTSINFDNTAYNVSKITTTVIETLTEDYPKAVSDPLDTIILSKINLDEAFEPTFTAELKPADVNKLNSDNLKAYNYGVPIIELPEEVENYYNLFNNANSAVSTAIASPLLAMRETMALITAPAKFTTTVQARLNTLISTFDALRATIGNITGLGSKQVYQAQAATLISSMCLAAVTPLPGNYTNSTTALAVIDTLFENYNLFLADLDILQSIDGSTPESFIPSADPIIQLNDLVNTTLSNLFDIVLTAKKERSIICETDTNLIILTHRLYTLDPNDKNMEELQINNSLSLSELIQIRKGRKIVYYL